MCDDKLDCLFKYCLDVLWPIGEKTLPPIAYRLASTIAYCLSAIAHRLSLDIQADTLYTDHVYNIYI